LKSVLTLRAASDIETDAHWYEAKREGLGMEFTERVLEGIEAIELNPYGFAKRIGEARRCGLSQFTEYGLWFVIRDDAVIIGCLHGRREPRLATERALGILPFPKKPDP
jgi:hypothetical protein